MNIDGNRITFKTEGINFYKERDNQKCNTVRRFSDWEELKAFQEFRELCDCSGEEQTIRIDGGTEGLFERIISDITVFEGYFIISWRSA